MIIFLMYFIVSFDHVIFEFWGFSPKFFNFSSPTCFEVFSSSTVAVARLFVNQISVGWAVPLVERWMGWSMSILNLHTSHWQNFLLSNFGNQGHMHSSITWSFLPLGIYNAIVIFLSLFGQIRRNMCTLTLLYKIWLALVDLAFPCCIYVAVPLWTKTLCNFLRRAAVS